MRDEDIRRLGDIEIDLVSVQKLASIIAAAAVAGIVAWFVNQDALNAGYDSKTAFNYEIISFFVSLVILYGLISIMVRRW